MTPEANTHSERPAWWRRWIVQPVVNQLTQGSSPDRLAWTIAAGVALGIFPIMGTTTLVCAAAGWIFGLNQPILHLFKSAVYPLHLGLILVFIHAGERLFGVPLIALSIPDLVSRFKTDPLQFCKDFGVAAGHGVAAWLLIAPLLALTIKFTVVPLLRRLANQLNHRKEVSI